MRLEGISAAVTGGASGLGLATARKMVKAGATVTLIDLPTSQGEESARELGDAARFVPADVTDEQQFAAALDAAEEAGPLRALVHCAGRGARIRLVEKDGSPGELSAFEDVIQLNLIGSYNALRLGAARMARHEDVDGERGAVVLTASVAAFDGQIGQIAYTASKSAIVGMTLCSARDLASKNIRVCTIAPGIMDTPLLGRLREDVRQGLEQSVPSPQRLGDPAEFGALACNIVENPYLNGETIRLDGGIRMAPR
ncbi:SDR family NAD(P)-dependent oxidoreductase [Saccharopolyspora sp. HNM0983]|uniref:SDR family NAD(P)-dependent oxidoreductase n=1 Tax=Saccharopolyspora montiporae TaxID=2781240 RepID=A0A929G1H9_9PSEU|nr:SDR family NAD(P)-dependent oxidoreductase [Saccharopolyspora sp. HNM0983]MBE9375862.1 SDR family NAD(P)-dependent oxidoreductase [Saccharopolyspora sp. HNM0983]